MSRKKWRQPKPPIRAAKATQRDNPREFKIAAKAACSITAAGGEAKLGTFSGTAYTGQPMRPMGWWNDIIIDLAGVKIPSQHRPALRQHDHEQIVGHTTAVSAGSDGIGVEGVFSGQPEHVEKVTVPARNGFQWQLSVGANPIRTEFLEAGEETEVNGRAVRGPLTISRETEIGEISFVPLGADGDTSVDVAAQRGNTMNPFAATIKHLVAGLRAKGKFKAAKYNDDEIDKMSEDDAKSALKKCMAEDDDESDSESADDGDGDEDGDEGNRSDASRRSGVNANRRNTTGQRGRSDIRAEVRAELDRAREESAAEQDRQSDIRAAVSKHLGDNDRIELDGKTTNLIAHAIREKWAPEKAELTALRFARPSGSVGLPGGLGYSPSTPAVNSAVLEMAVFDAMGGLPLFDENFYRKGDANTAGIDGRRVNAAFERKITLDLRSRYTDQVQQAAHTLFKGRLGLQQLFTIAAGQNGYRGSEVIRDEGTWAIVAHHLQASAARNLAALARGGMAIEADGGSAIDISNVLANVQNKFLLLGYLFTEQAYLDLCFVRPVKDFKPTSSLALWGDSEFKDIGPDGQIDHGTIMDQAFSNQAAMRARMLTIPLQHIINDDLGALGQVPQILGRGWGLKVNKLFWTMWMNPGKDDGGSTDFYAATHTLTNGATGNSNYQSGGSTAMSADSLQAAEILFFNQIDPQGNPLGVDPELLVFPPDIKATVWNLMNSEFIVVTALGSTAAKATAGAKNPWYGRFKPVMSRYLNKSAYTGYSTTAWYMIANPAIMPVIEIAAWNGNLIPTVQTASADFQFNTLGISMRGFGGVGVNKQNFRGGVKSAGV